MIRMSALNDESDEESGSEEEVTREALEQIALQQYAKALELQRKGNLQDATQLIKDLLDTELLYDVKKPAHGEKVTSPLFNLKYLCYKNLAGMLTTSGDVEAAIEAYCAASDLDDTDITLWHKLGLLCMHTKQYEMALNAFQHGAERNPRYWPCLDKIVTLQLGLDFKEECISTIHDALQLDTGYLRGLAYRKYIYTLYPHMKDYMEYLNPIYKWNPKEDEPIDEERAEKLIKEADDINDFFLAQQKAQAFKSILPDLKLRKPIGQLSWNSVGESLVHMHNYMTENSFSHACYIELVFEKEEPMEVCEVLKIEEAVEIKVDENNIETEKNSENVSENENNDMSDKDRPTTDTEKVESDIEFVPIESATETLAESKLPKKTPVRRRGSALSFLQQWEWCTKRRSGRKKPVNRQDLDDNIYDTLRRMVPNFLSPDLVQKKDNQDREMSPDTSGLNHQFEVTDPQKEDNEVYFGTDNEQKDVKEFIEKYTENKKDIIDMFQEYLNILAGKWRIKWPDGLSKVFIEANKCYNNHIDVPSCIGDNKLELLHYTAVNMLVEEFTVNEKLNSVSEDKENHDLSVIETIGLGLSLKPHIFASTDCLELMLRYLWCKLHIHILNKCEDFGLDCLYQLLHEFEAMAEHHDTYFLHVTNFTFKPLINESNILQGITFLERNKKLSTVMDLYERGNYGEVLSILIDSFEHCKIMARNQEKEISLDFAVQLSLILDTYWALNKTEDCFRWSFICLHEALKHYFRCTSDSPDYEKWTLAVVKILCCMEHILTTEGLICLESIPKTELCQGLDNLIRIIGHQVETNVSEMPFDTVIPWIIMHYILQREEDQGRTETFEKDKMACDDVPNPLLVLFIAHEQLGTRGWCCKSDGKLLYFILDTVVPRLRSPSLSKPLEQVCQYMEQCVYCLFGHPGRKTKLKYLVDHNVNSYPLDWKRAQQLYEIFRPPILPALEGKIPGITTDTEQLFHRILALMPSECDPSKYVSEIEKYIKGIENKLPSVPALLPYKMKDIYFLLGDYYFKREEGKMAIKYNILDVAVNNNRLESWAEISLAKAVNLERLLNSCKNLNNERECLNPAKSIIRCFKRSLELDPTHCNMWIEYGMFVYTIHSFCSRLLKQASESLSMEDFESLEKQKEDMLDTTHKCFTTVLNDLKNSNEPEKENEDSWLYFYMLGKVSEKRNKPPSVYLDYYINGVKSLQETDATYPLKINYNTPTNLCIEVLELHYRIHASILKYIEQHENKPIPSSVGKVFMTCIEEWKKSSFCKKPKKDGMSETENESAKPPEHVQAANILKRSISDAGEDDNHEMKRLKLEAAAAKVRRSASYDTERIAPKEQVEKIDTATDTVKAVPLPEDKRVATPEKPKEGAKVSEQANTEINTENIDKPEPKKDSNMEKKDDTSSASSSSSSESSSSETSSDSSSDSSRGSDTSSKSLNDSKPLTDEEIMNIISACLDALEDCASRFPPHYKAIYRLAHYHFYYKKGKDIERCRDLMLSNFTSRAGHKLAGLFSERKHSNFFNNIWKIPLTEVDRAGGFAFHMSRSILLTMEILKEIDDHKTLLDLSLYLQRIPELDKKYLRDSDREELAQQAFSLCVQSLKGQLTKFGQQADLKSNEVERQALNSLMLDIYRAYQRAQKQPNSKQFTNLLIEGYKLVTTEPVSENSNLVDLSMKYCQRLIQKLKHEATLASLDKNQNTQKKQAAKAVETVKPSTSTVNQLKVDPKPTTTSTSAASGLPKISANEMAAAFQNYLPMLNDPMLSQQTAAALSLSYLSNISALAGYSSLQNTLQSSLQSSLQNSFQAEFYRQFLGQSISSYVPPNKKVKRGTKPAPVKPTVNPLKPTVNPLKPTMNPLKPTVNPLKPTINPMKPTVNPLKPTVNPLKPTVNPLKPTVNLLKQSKSFTIPMTSVTKATPTPVISGLQKSSSTSLTPSMGTVLSTLPASMTANLSSFGAGTSHSSSHYKSTSTVNAASHSKLSLSHQQVSPGKTLQEKLAERQKHMPISKVQEINASISKLPSSLTITKTSISKPIKKSEPKKTLPFGGGERPKPITSDEIIVLDDD